MYFLTPCAFRGDPAAAAVSKISVSKGCRFTSPLCIVGAGGYIYTYIYILCIFYIGGNLVINGVAHSSNEWMIFLEKIGPQQKSFR